MVVEFIGVSGSGKTAVADALLQAAPGVEAGRRSLARDGRHGGRAPWRTVLGLWFAIPMYIRLMTSDRDVRQWWRALSARAQLGLLSLAARYRWQANSGGAVLYDQGLVQRIVYRTRPWVAAVDERLLVGVYEAIGRKAMPGVLVLFSVDPALAGGRAKMRSYIHHDPDEIRNLTQTLVTHATLLERRYGAQLVTVQNDGAIESTVAQVCTALALSSRPRG